MTKTTAALMVLLACTSAAARMVDIQYVSAASGSRSSAIGYGTLNNGNAVWSDTPKTYFVEVPEWMKGLSLAKPARLVSAGARLTWSCPNQGAKCQCFIYQYHCPGCNYQDGGLAALLAADPVKVWEKINCAPKFQVDQGPGDEAHHPMIAYRTIADPDEQVTVDLPAETDYILIGGDGDKLLVDCSSYRTPMSCEDASLKGQCEWDLPQGSCVDRTCISKWKGPIGGPPSPTGLPGKPTLPPSPTGPHIPKTCLNRCVELDLPFN